jgi:hypothetical protein
MGPQFRRKSETDVLLCVVHAMGFLPLGMAPTEHYPDQHHRHESKNVQQAPPSPGPPPPPYQKFTLAEQQKKALSSVKRSASTIAPPPPPTLKTQTTKTAGVTESKNGEAPGKKQNSNHKRPAPCNCKKSKCLKLYCVCFGAELFCQGCRCVDCNNTPGFEKARSNAIKEIRSKNHNAFKPRLEVAPEEAGQGAHNMGCTCSKTGCLKKYCEVSCCSIAKLGI